MGVCLVGVDGRDGGILLHGNRIGKIGWAPSTALYPEHGQPRSARTSAQKWILFADSESRLEPLREVYMRCVLPVC
ncbi:unnamed protein product [Acanthoscelides obtectus]|uniref:Uncharacterized protein n=1 Tax=Acanthoscelides obtectus TaxID=200917 RepID=A0A9P0KII5_ACAOB|nr:unnamed protein product [Acanthoscelides obtectus]CAK1677238.1 hypothetical protein AOBTE_LOCUS31199 [Acanthoscelides obtectus]